MNKMKLNRNANSFKSFTNGQVNNMISFNKNAYNLIFNNLSDENEVFSDFNEARKHQQKFQAYPDNKRQKTN